MKFFATTWGLVIGACVMIGGSAFCQEHDFGMASGLLMIGYFGLLMVRMKLASLNPYGMRMSDERRMPVLSGICVAAVCGVVFGVPALRMLHGG